MERLFALSFIVYSVRIELALADLDDKISFVRTKFSIYSFLMSLVFGWCNKGSSQIKVVQYASLKNFNRANFISVE